MSMSRMCKHVVVVDEIKYMKQTKQKQKLEIKSNCNGGFYFSLHIRIAYDE